MGARPEGFREAATCPDLGAGIPVGQEGGAGSPDPGVAGQPLCEVDFSAVLESPMSTGEMGVTGFPHRRAPLNHTARRSDSRGLGTAGVPRPDTGAQSPEQGASPSFRAPSFYSLPPHLGAHGGSPGALARAQASLCGRHPVLPWARLSGGTAAMCTVMGQPHAPSLPNHHAAPP